MADDEDLYAILGVARISDDVVIRAAFEALMLKHHPDTNRSTDATRRAASINAAFAILSDPVKRASYDFASVTRSQSPFSAPFPRSPGAAAPAPWLPLARRWYRANWIIGTMAVVAIGSFVIVGNQLQGPSAPERAAAANGGTTAAMNEVSALDISAVDARMNPSVDNAMLTTR